MDPRDYLTAIRKSWIVIVVFALIGLVVAFGYGRTQKDVYQATSSVFVGSSQGASVDQLSQGQTYIHNFVVSLPGLATTPAVLDPVISELGLPMSAGQLGRQITASNPLNTVFVQIQVADGSPTRAADIANAVARSLRTVAAGLTPTSSGGGPSITVAIVGPASAPLGARTPNRHLEYLTGAIIGLAAGILVAVLRLLFDTRLRSARDVEGAASTPVVGTVRRRVRSAEEGIALVDAPESAVAEDYRRVRATLQYALPDRDLGSVLVTSPLSGRESIDVALNIALATAERSKRVLLIDADLRTSDLATAAGLPAGPGLTDVLEGSITLADGVARLADTLDVLTSGQGHSNPHFALGSTAFVRVVEEAKAAYDFVVVVAPPVLVASDAVTLAHVADGTLVVATAKRTTRPQLVRTLDALDGVRADVIGVVLVDVRQPGRKEEPADSSSPRSDPPSDDSEAMPQLADGAEADAPVDVVAHEGALPMRRRRTPNETAR